MAKVQLPVRVEKEVFESLKKLADKDNRPLSNYVDTVLKNNIESKKLISAAPELLKALSDIIESVNNDLGEFKGVDKNSLYIKYAKEDIEKATK